MTFLNIGISFGMLVVVLGGNTSMMSGLSVALWSVSKKVIVDVPENLHESFPISTCTVKSELVAALK